MSTFALEIVSPDQKVYEGQVSSVQLPGIQGSFEVLVNHAPLISPLAEGQVNLRTAAGEARQFPIRGGVVEVLDNHVVVLAS